MQFYILQLWLSGAAYGKRINTVEDQANALDPTSVLPTAYFAPTADFAVEAGIERYVRISKLKAQGHCRSGYIADGDDDQYLSEGACVQACSTNAACQAISYCPPDLKVCKDEGACKRYRGLCSEQDLHCNDPACPHYVSYSKTPYKIVTVEDDFDVENHTTAEFVRTKAYLREHLPDGGKVAIVSMYSAFAPVTKAQLNGFIKAREKLLQNGFDLVLGVLSFKYADRNDWGALNSRGELNIPLHTRLELASCAFEDAYMPWMFAEQQTNDHYESLRQDSEFGTYDFDTFELHGADDIYNNQLYEQCGSPDSKKYVILGRPGDTDDIEGKMREAGVSGEDVDCLWIDNYNSFSSSMLRDTAISGMREHVYDIADRCVAVFMNGPYLKAFARHDTNLQKRRVIAQQKDGFPEVILRDDDGKMSGSIANDATVVIVNETDSAFKVRAGNIIGWAKKHNWIEVLD